jgi:large subunit ribosomal protein L9
MEVILLERVGKLGQIGDVVRVRDGYGRNFLLARGKALRATEANRKKFETQRADLEARNAQAKDAAAAQGAQIDGKVVVLIRQSGETGILYGSVSARDIATALAADGMSVDRNQIHIAAPIKTLGLHKVPVVLHPEVSVTVSVNVARSPEEAERQQRGEEVLVREENSLDDLGLEIGAALAEAGDDR